MGESPLGAKAIYLFLRAEAKQDLDIYSEIEGIMTEEFYEPWNILNTSGIVMGYLRNIPDTNKQGCEGRAF